LDWVFVGLGNPGANYALNRHNVGFMAVDVIADSFRGPPFKIKSNAALSEISLPGQRLFFVKPQTFMNVSARGVAPLLAFYKIPLDHVIVFHDDLDLEPGRIKIKCGGSSGGHNGLKSLDQSIGSDYWRVRIGIGHPGHKDAVNGYVLSNFRREELDNWVPDQLGRLAATIDGFLETMDAAAWMRRL
jgi:PTH1 family peptidyl-tRNA hydrolase